VRCIACALGTSIEAYCATRGTAAACRVVPAFLTGHLWVGLTARVPKDAGAEQLGYTHYTPVWTLLDKPVEHNYGTSSQWIQANDGVQDPQNRDLGWPWGSIEGGHMVSAPHGGARYQVNASTHRWNPYSDVAGGYGFSGGALPFKYLARVALSERLILPPHGVCFQGQDEGKLFGNGWVAMPLFDFDSAGVAKDALTWTFFADAENFCGPVCCYPPQYWARRIESWRQFRRKQDPNLHEAYLRTTHISKSLAFEWVPARTPYDYFRAGGEIPNVPCAFATADDDAAKVPGLRIPAAGTPWLADATFYTEHNFALAKKSFLAGGPVRLVGTPAELPGTGQEIEIGVMRAGGPAGPGGRNGPEKLLDIDARINKEGEAYVVRGSDAGKTIGRYFAAGEKHDKTGQGRAVLSQIGTHALLEKSDYAAYVKTNAYRNDALEAYVRAKSHGGIRETRLEDGTVVRYGLVRFIDQPAIASLAQDFPSDFTPEKRAEIQRRFEVMCATNFKGQTRRSNWPLARIDAGLVLSSTVPGYVPIAVGASGHVTQPDYDDAW
jgi:hypothetical protein